MRGHSADFDRWAQKGARAGATPTCCPTSGGWSARGAATDNYGADGPLPVTPNGTELPAPRRADAGDPSAAGYPVTHDIHAGDEEGGSRVELTIDEKGRRASTYESLSQARDGAAEPHRGDRSADPARAGRGQAAPSASNTKSAARLRTARAGEVILCGRRLQLAPAPAALGHRPRRTSRRDGHSAGARPARRRPQPRRSIRACRCEFEAKGPITFVNQLRFDRAASNVLRWYLFGTGPFARQLNSANPMLRTDPRLAQPDIQLFSNPVKLDRAPVVPRLGEEPRARLQRRRDPAPPAGARHGAAKVRRSARATGATPQPVRRRGRLRHRTRGAAPGRAGSMAPSRWPA